MKKLEFYGAGKTIEDAKSDALSKVNAEYDSVEFEVTKMPEKKKLGLFGGSEAEVKAIISIDTNKEVRKFLETVVSKFDITDLNITQSEEDNRLTFDIQGENLGALIGHRGETLNALQYLTGLVANKEKGSFRKVTINVGDYRQKRDKVIENIARKNAMRALKIRRNVFLEPMNSYERRIIHTVVQEIDGVKSWSEGEKRDRHVVIGLDGTKKPVHRDDESTHSLYEKIN